MFNWKSYIKAPLLIASFVVAHVAASGFCTARFSFVDTGLLVTFYDSSSVNMVNKKWIFGDGDTVTTQNKGTSHTYKSFGTFSVKLVAYDSFGTCYDTAYQSIKLSKNCSAQFSYKDNGFGKIKFTNLSQGFAPIYSEWKFGDNSTSKKTNPNHTYTLSSTFNVCLLTVDSLGCTDSICKNVTIGPQCKAAFSFKLAGSDPYIYEFTNNSQNVGNAKYTWDFGNDSTSTQVDPITEFAKDGIYTVALIATSASKNCADTITKRVTVKGNCEANFTAPSFVNNSLTVPFGSTSKGVGLSHIWNFGDGNSAANSNPTHIYGAPGIYDVELIILDTMERCTDTIRKPIRVSGLCTVDFGYSFDKSSRVTTFTNLSSDTTKGNSYIRWYLGDGANDFSGNNRIFHTYKISGTYSASLAYTNQYGCTDSISKTVIIPNTGCQARFGFKDEGEFDLDVLFLDSSIGDSIITRWDFGDGNSSTQLDPIHSYPDAGTYRVRLIATDVPNGCIDTVEKNIEVKVPGCDANFSLKTSGLEMAITNLSNGYKPIYEWDFGDGSKRSNDKEPSHTYAKSGNYTVKLSLTGSLGHCSNDFSRKITIADPADACTANFTYKVDTLDLSKVEFSDLSSGAIKTHKWDFGDGQTSSQPNPVHYYKSPGTYQASLIVKDSSEQCEDTVVSSIEIREPPCDIRYEFVIDPREKYTVFVRIADLEHYSDVEWTFGDGDRTKERYPEKYYSSVGRYELCLKINDPNCQSTYCDSFTIDDLGEFSLKRGFKLTVFSDFVGASREIESSKMDASLYPNPFNQQLFVETNEPITQLSIKDLAGRNLPVSILEKGGDRVLIDTSSLPGGVYLLEVEADNKKSTFRIMKN